MYFIIAIFVLLIVLFHYNNRSTEGFYPDYSCASVMEPQSWKLNRCGVFHDEFSTQYPEADQVTRNEFINWCHSYYRRHDMHPKRKHARDWFLRFMEVNNNFQNQ
jgi:hypothetical protein